MKHLFMAVFCMATMMAQAQEVPQPFISVNGEGTIKVMPDRVLIHTGIENTGKDAKEVKTLNDVAMDKVLKFLKAIGIPQQDYQTTQVRLHRSYDSEKKKNVFRATQSLKIILKDVSKYDELMIGLMDQGINTIQGVEFTSSQMELHQAEARKQAIIHAKKKAEDYVSVLGQKVGKALQIEEQNSGMFPPMYRNAMMIESDTSISRETLAIGEMEIKAQVQVRFLLE
ncbi:MAG: SIMPL domain-containing protein [Flavobacterium sp.]